MSRRFLLRPTGSAPVETELDEHREGEFVFRTASGQLMGRSEQLPSGELLLRLGERNVTVFSARTRDELLLWVEGQTYRFSLDTEPGTGPAAADAGDDREIRAPMPGKVVEVRVRAGDAVRAGDLLAVMESMKVRFNLTAPRDGTVEEVDCAVGDLVELGAVLTRLEPNA